MNTKTQVLDTDCSGVLKARAAARQREHFASLFATLTGVISKDPQLLRDVIDITFSRMRDGDVEHCPYIVADLHELSCVICPVTSETVFYDGEYCHTLAQLYVERAKHDLGQFGLEYGYGNTPDKETDTSLELASTWNRIPMHSLELEDEVHECDDVVVYNDSDIFAQYGPQRNVPCEEVIEETVIYDGPLADFLSSGRSKPA